ncbi:MAG TPA: methylmalonyl-CoA mutase family protein [Aeromicrobium sp.]|nr:methylmalonyl-CoA mutase family protein [Aeromicrobium sp.]HKY58252.1 methylmalonyl-CoA mutase family protein [Aeromicrobium sp.]
MANPVHVPLADEQDFSAADWEAATAGVLRRLRRLADDAPDSDVWSVLAHTTLDGLTITPLGTSAAQAPDPGVPGSAPFTRGAGAAGAAELDGWDIRAWFADPDVQTTVEHVHTDLENGVNSLWLAVGEGAVPVDAIATVLERVFVDLAPVVLDAPDAPLEAAQALDAVLADKAVTPAVGTNYGADPIGAAARGQGEADVTVAVAVARLAAARGARAIVVDATAVHDAGASDVQELAYSLAAGVAYLRALVAAGFSVDDAAAQIDFRYAATDEQFVTIAKLRAARRLWSRVLELSGATPSGQRQHAVTSRPMYSAYDPYVNMLRATVAAFAAGVGGAQAVTTLPFDEPIGLPVPFSRRIARNISSLLISESHVATVADAGGGSYLVEQLTDEVARAGWALFGELDADGGIVAAMADGRLHDRINHVVAERERLIGTRAKPLTGVSEFPNLGEEPLERRPYGRTFPVRRWGASYEALRGEPAASPVFVATLGTVAQHTARATFLTNLLAAGGIDTTLAGATADAAEVLAAYNAAGQPDVVALAGPDDLYAERGAETIEALRGAGARHVILAGKPRDLPFADAVDDSAAMGVDALAFLRRTREELA